MILTGMFRDHGPHDQTTRRLQRSRINVQCSACAAAETYPERRRRLLWRTAKPAFVEGAQPVRKRFWLHGGNPGKDTVARRDKSDLTGVPLTRQHAGLAGVAAIGSVKPSNAHRSHGLQRLF